MPPAAALLGHQRFDPIYATAQRLNVPIAVHAAGTDMTARRFYKL